MVARTTYRLSASFSESEVMRVGGLTHDEGDTVLSAIEAEALLGLREANEKLRLFIEHAPAAIAMLDNEMRYLAASRRWYVDYGVVDPDIIGRTHYEVFPDLPYRWREIHRRVLDGAIESHEADPWPRADGHVDWVRWECRPWYRGDGSIGGMIIFSQAITEQVETQRALQESEGSVRRRLDAMLKPDADIGELKLIDVLDLPAVDVMLHDFYRLTGLSVAVVDLHATPLASAGTARVCEEFHRADPLCSVRCRKTDEALILGIPEGQSRLVRCDNGMWVVAAPFYVAARQLGSLFAGRFFFEGDDVDLDFFRAQAYQFGFDESEYLSAVAEVPRLTREDVEAGVSLLVNASGLISKLSWGTVRLAGALAEQERLTQHAHRQAAAISGVNEVFDAAFSAGSEGKFAEQCLEIAQKVTGSRIGFLAEVGEDGALNDIAISDPGWTACRMKGPSGHREPCSTAIRGVYGQAILNDAPFMTNDPGAEDVSIGLPEGHPPLTAFLGIPLHWGDRVFGMVGVANKPGGYCEEDRDLLQALGPTIVEALQRMRSEHALLEATQRLDAHIGNSPLALIEFDAQFRIIRWSAEAERMFGWSAQEVLGKGIDEMRWVYDEDAALVESEAGRLTTGVGQGVTVNRNYRKDGSVIWCEWYDSAIYDADGAMVSVMAQVLDITARKKAETTARHTTEHFRLLAESARLLLTTEDPEQVVHTIAMQVMAHMNCQVFFNYLIEPDGQGMRLNAYAGVPEATADQMSHLGLGVAVCGCVARDGQRIIAEEIQDDADPRTELVRSLGVQAYCCHPLVAHGETIGTLSFGTTTRTRFTGEEIEFMRVVADQAATAMARKRADDGLRASREAIDAERLWLRRIIDEIPIGVTLLDEHGAVLDVNETTNRIWGRTAAIGDLPRAEHPAEYDMYKAFDRETGRQLEGDDWPVVRTLKTHAKATKTVDIERNDGTTAVVRFTTVPILDDAAHLTGAVGLTEDVTAEVEARRLDDALVAIRSRVSSTLSSEEILHWLVIEAKEALAADTGGLTVLEGGAWAIRELVGTPMAKVTNGLIDHQLSMTRLAAEERRPVAIGNVAQDPHVNARMMKKLGVTALLAMPVIVRHEVVAVLLFQHRSESAGFSAEDVEFASKLMGIAALALENARLYERERGIAETLQDAILTAPESLEGIETFCLYRPASDSARVGGDFYDVFELLGGRVGIVVGDVSGKGIEAARLTSLVRDGIRAYAYENHDPTWVLGRVNALVHRSTPVGAFATVFFGVLDHTTSTLEYSSGGHPPAMLSHGGRVKVLSGGHSPIVGAFENPSFTSASIDFKSGDRLLLYTDGVIEARRDGQQFGEKRLLQAIRARRKASLAEWPASLFAEVSAFAGGRLADDIVIVCVERS